MSRILKPHSVSQSDDVVLIPDAEPIPLFDPDGAPELRGVMHDELYESALQKAREEADAMGAKLRALAQKECEQLRQQAVAEGEELRRQAMAEGYESGVSQRVAEIDACIGQVAACVGELQVEFQRYLDDYAAQLQVLAADIASRVLCERVEKDDLALLPLVRQAVHSVRDVDWISVEVSQRLPALVRQLEEDYAGRDTGETRVESAGQDLAKDACVIQTTEGIIDASVSTQIENLKALFQDLDETDGD